MPHLRELTADEVKFSFDWEPEWDSPKGHFDDPRDVQWVYDQLKRGNEAAWFIAKVTAKWGIFEGVDFLGGCSYVSFDDFKAEDGYYPDMKAQALADLNREIALAYRDIEKLVVDGEKPVEVK